MERRGQTRLVEMPPDKTTGRRRYDLQKDSVSTGIVIEIHAGKLDHLRLLEKLAKGLDLFEFVETLK